MKTITAAQLYKRLQDKKDTLISINVLPEEFFASETIPDSLNFCVYKTSFIEDVKKAIKDKKQEIVVFGQNKKYGAAERAAYFLGSAGYKNVTVFLGGIDAWKKAGYKIKGSKKAAQQPLHKKNFSIDTKESYVAWDGSNMFNKHFGQVLTATKSSVFKGEIILDMKKITCEDLTNKAMNRALISHLKSSDFFDVKEYPTAKLTFQKVTPKSAVVSDLTYKVEGKLTIKNITHPVKFEIHGHYSDKKLVAQGDLVIDRSKWNVQYGSGRFFEALGQHLVHDQVRLRFKIVAN